jgi:hypothetical protein
MYTHCVTSIAVAPIILQIRGFYFALDSINISADQKIICLFTSLGLLCNDYKIRGLIRLCKWMEQFFFETSGTTTLHHISKKPNFLKYCCEKLKSCVICFIWRRCLKKIVNIQYKRYREDLWITNWKGLCWYEIYTLWIFMQPDPGRNNINFQRL